MSIFRSLCGSCTGFALANEIPQILIIGADKAGKTSFLYRMKVGKAWKFEDMARDFEELRKPGADGKTDDYGYHFEEMQLIKGVTCGVWEVPGTVALRHTWSTFYRAIKFHAVLFVVNAAEQREEQINASRRMLHFLMNEDELRGAVFAVIINTRHPKVEPVKVNGRSETEEEKVAVKVRQEQIYYKLGISELHPSCAWRVERFELNCLDIDKESDPRLTPLRDWLREKVQEPGGYGLKL